VLNNSIYFDNQSYAQPTKEVVAAQLPYLSRHFVGAEAPYTLGQQLLPKLDEAYRTLYRFIGATYADHFVLTSSGAEAVGHVIFSTYMDLSRTSGKNHFVTTNLEEASTIMSMSRLTQLGAIFEMAKADSRGIVTAAAIAEVLTPRTALVSISLANGLTGVLQPIEEIAKVCQERGVLLHVDATHLLGKTKIDFSSLPVDFITFAGTPLHAPKNTGALFIKSHQSLSPFIVGDKAQAEMRAGGLDVAALMGLAKAVEQMGEHRDRYGIEVARLRNYFETQLQKRLPCVSTPFQEQRRASNISLLLFEGIHAEALAYFLNQNNLVACMGGGHFQKLCHLLTACGIAPGASHSGLSFSFCRNMTQSVVDEAVEKIVTSVNQLEKVML